MRPGEFRLPRHVEGGWEIGGFFYDENPMFTAPAWATALVLTWLRLNRDRGVGPMGRGPVILLRGGGYCDQPALAMEAFEMFDKWAQEGRDGD